MSIDARSLEVLSGRAASADIGVLAAVNTSSGAARAPDRALFRSAHSAVGWAYETATRVPVNSMMIYSMGRPRVPSSMGLTPDEAHAQASLILSLVERTCDPIELAYVRAKYGRQFDALERLRGAVLATLGTGFHSNRAVEKVLLMYFGQPIGIRSLQQDLRRRTADVVAWRHDRFDYLDRLHRRALGKLDEELRSCGVVG